MHGQPDDVDGQCNARLYLADDYGDNQCTIRCRREPGHEGPHEEKFMRAGSPVTITWYVDERGIDDAPVHFGDGEWLDDEVPLL